MLQLLNGAFDAHVLKIIRIQIPYAQRILWKLIKMCCILRYISKWLWPWSILIKKALKTSLSPIIIIPRSDLGLCLDFRDDSRLLTGATSPGSSRSAHLTLISDLGLSGLGDGDFRLRTTLAVGSCGVYN